MIDVRESELGSMMKASECQELGMRFMENGVKEEGVLGGEKKRGLLDECDHSPSEPVEQPVRHHLTRVMRPLNFITTLGNGMGLTLERLPLPFPFPLFDIFDFRLIDGRYG